MEHTKIQESSQDEISQKQRILHSICSFYISKTELSTAKARETILTVNRLINLLTLGKLVLPNTSNAVPSIPVCVLQAVVEAMASKTPINSPVNSPRGYEQAMSSEDQCTEISGGVRSMALLPGQTTADATKQCPGAPRAIVRALNLRTSQPAANINRTGDLCVLLRD